MDYPVRPGVTKRIQGASFSVSNLCAHVDVEQEGYGSLPITYELDFSCLKQEIIDIKNRSETEGTGIALAAEHLEVLKIQKQTTQEVIGTAQNKFRQIVNKFDSTVTTQSVSGYAENHHESLVQSFHVKTDSINRLRCRLDNSNKRKGNLKEHHEQILLDIRQLQLQTPVKKQVLRKQRLDLANRKDEQIRNIQQQLIATKNAAEEKDSAIALLQEKLAAECSLVTKEHAKFKSLLHEAKTTHAEIEAKCQQELGGPRRMLSEIQFKRIKRQQESAQTTIDLRNRIDFYLSQQSQCEEQISQLNQKNLYFAQKQKDLEWAHESLSRKTHQMLCDYQIVEPVMKKVAAKLRLLKNKMNVRMSQNEDKLKEQIESYLNDLHDFQNKLCVRHEEDKSQQELAAAHARTSQMKHLALSQQNKIDEITKWKTKMEAVGVTPQSYLLRLQERMEFLKAELLSVQKQRILCTVKQPQRTSVAGENWCQGNSCCQGSCPTFIPNPKIMELVKEAVPLSKCDPGFYETVTEAFIGAHDHPSDMCTCPKKSGLDECSAICKKYLFRPGRAAS